MTVPFDPPQWWMPSPVWHWPSPPPSPGVVITTDSLILDGPIDVPAPAWMTDERLACIAGPTVAVISFAVTLGLIVWRIRAAERRNP